MSRTARISEMISKLSDRDRRALFLGVWLILPVVFYMGAVRPYRNALAEITVRTASETALLSRERALIESSSELLEGLRAASHEARRADYRLVSASNTALAEAALTDRLEDMAFQSRVLLEEFRGIEPGRDEASPAGMSPVRLEVRGESDMEGVLSFLERVETSSLLLRISAVSLQPVTETPEGSGESQERSEPQPTGVVEFALIVEAYAEVVDSGIQNPNEL